MYTRARGNNFLKNNFVNFQGTEANKLTEQSTLSQCQTMLIHEDRFFIAKSDQICQSKHQKV